MPLEYFEPNLDVSLFLSRKHKSESEETDSLVAPVMQNRTTEAKDGIVGNKVLDIWDDYVVPSPCCQVFIFFVSTPFSVLKYFMRQCFGRD